MANSRGSSDKAKSCLDKLIGDISKTGAVKQVALGTTSGCVELEQCGIYAVKNFLMLSASRQRIKKERIKKCLRVLTGMLAIKAGKVAALAAGTTIVILQVANHAGYIKVNWDRVGKQLEKVSDKVEEKATGSGPNWMNKVERYVDKKLDKAEEKLTQNERKAKRWYSNFIGDDKTYKLEDIHIFLVSFAGGVALGIATS